MNIDRILLIIIIIYLIFSHFKKNKNIEKFAVTDDIKSAIKEIYNTDMDAIRTLSDFAKKIQDGNNLNIPGNLTVTGTIIGKDEIKTVDSNNKDKALLNNVNTNTNSNSSSITSINSSITSINSSLTTINSSLANKIDTNTNINLEAISKPGFKFTLNPLNNETPILFNQSSISLPMIGTFNFNYNWKITKS
jgi:hypothetical protein